VRAAAASVQAERSTPSMKTCTECGRAMPLNTFVRIRSTKSPHNLRCRDCRRPQGFELIAPVMPQSFVLPSSESLRQKSGYLKPP
jgi:hypothetical protein